MLPWEISGWLQRPSTGMDLLDLPIHCNGGAFIAFEKWLLKSSKHRSMRHRLQLKHFVGVLYFK